MGAIDGVSSSTPPTSQQNNISPLQQLKPKHKKQKHIKTCNKTQTP